MFFFLLKNDLLSIKNVYGEFHLTWNKAGCEVKTKCYL